MSRVLLVEDNDSTAQAICEFLEAQGYSVRVARTAGEAIQEGRSFQPKLLLCSWLLEGDQGGREVALKLRGAIPDLAVAFLSGLPPESIQPHIQGLPVAGILAKPASLDQVRRMVRDAIGDPEV